MAGGRQTFQVWMKREPCACESCFVCAWLHESAVQAASHFVNVLAVLFCFVLLSQVLSECVSILNAIMLRLFCSCVFQRLFYLFCRGESWLVFCNRTAANHVLDFAFWVLIMGHTGHSPGPFQFSHHFCIVLLCHQTLDTLRHCTGKTSGKF